MSLNIVNTFKLAQPIIGGWKELGRTTLASPDTFIDVIGLADKRFYLVLTDATIDTSAGQEEVIRTGNGSFDTGNNYSYRRSINGVADVTTTNTSFVGGNGATGMGVGANTFYVNYIANLAANEKLFLVQTSQRGASGANTPDRVEVAGKWVVTSNPLDRYRIGFGVNTYTTGSEVVVLEWDPADVHTDNFWQETGTGSGSGCEDVTFTPKKYNWFQFFGQMGTTADLNLRLGNSALDTGNNYAYRVSRNGGADVTAANQSSVGLNTGFDTNFWFYISGFFVNNSANEKLGILEYTYINGVGPSNAPNRNPTTFKWANTSNQADHLGVFPSAGTLNAVSELRVWGSD